MAIQLSDNDWREVDRHLDMVLTAYKAGEAPLNEVRDHLSELIAVGVNQDEVSFKHTVGRTLTELFGASDHA